MQKNLWINGYRMTTAEIVYRMPDHPELLQSFIWQDLDLAPRYPVLNRFLKFWELELDGELHTVCVGSTDLITPRDLRHANVSLAVH